MKKNETQFYFNTNFEKNNLMKLKCGKSKKKNLSSRNPLLKIKDKISSKFKLFSNLTIYNNHSKETSSKNDELSKNDINSISERKNISSNYVNINENFLQSLPSKNNISKVFEPKTIYINNNANLKNILNIYQIKNKRKYFIKQKLLLRQKNDYIRLHQKEDSILSYFYFKNKNPYINNIKNYYINANKSRKFGFEQGDLNVNLINDKKDNFSFCSFKKDNNSQNKISLPKIKKLTKKYKIIKILKQSNSVLFGSKNNNIKEEKHLDKISNEKIKNKNNQKYIEHNISTEEEKIIGNNFCNDNLKDNSSIVLNKNKFQEISYSKNEDKTVIKNLTSLKNKLNDSNEIFQYTKRFNKYYYQNIFEKNNKKLFEYKMYASNERKNLDYIKKNISIKNIYLRNKILLEKNT